MSPKSDGSSLHPEFPARDAASVLLSVVVPCANEEEVLFETHRRLTEVLENIGMSFEIVYVMTEAPMQRPTCCENCSRRMTACAWCDSRGISAIRWQLPLGWSMPQAMRWR